MNQKHGFTIIELVAVIVILGLIALITTPIVVNVIGKSSLDTAKNSGEGLLKAAKVYHSKVMLESATGSSVTFTFPNGIDGLELGGDVPTSGTLVINADGTVKMAVIYESKYCVTKALTDENVTVTENTSSCTMPTT